MAKKELVWNVLNGPCSWSLDTPFKPEVFNVFSSYSFQRNLYQLKNDIKKKKLSRKDFDEELDKILRYTFWSRCEYEMILDSWPPHKNDKGYKIDVYEQVRLNFDKFSDYVWNNQKLIRKVEIR